MPVKKARETEVYLFEIEGWEVDLDFGITMGSVKNLYPDDFWEHSRLIFSGKIQSPALKSATTAKITVSSEPNLDDYQKRPPLEKTPISIGLMEIPRGSYSLDCIAWIPHRIFSNAIVASSAGRVRYIRIFGEKLKWRKGSIFNISFQTTYEDE